MGHARWLVTALVVVGACSDERAEPTSTSPAVPPSTSAAVELAPSQRVLPTVAPPTVPDGCAADAIELAVEPGTPPGSDIVVVFTNRGRLECEIDLGREWATGYEIEPSVRLDPGARGELWGVVTDPGCAAAGAEPAWELAINGTPRTVLLPPAACGVVPVAFFPT